MNKLTILTLATAVATAIQADTIDWYRFEEFERGMRLTDGVELVNSVPSGDAATLRVYDTSDDKYKPVAALVGTNVQTTVNDLCPVADDRSLNFQQYGKKNGSAVVVPEWESNASGGTYTPSSFTVETFFKLTGMSVNDSYRTFFAKTGTGTDNQTFRVFMVKEDDAQGGKLHVCLNDTLTRIDSVAATIRDGEWHHLALAYDAARRIATVYFDYTAVLISEVTLNSYDAARPLYVGSGGVYNTAGGGTNWNCFPGYVDDVRVSDKALVADELLRFRPLDWKGDDVLDISRTPAILPAPTVTVDKSVRGPGILGGSQAYADAAAVKTAWQGTDVFDDVVYSFPEMAYKSGSNQGWTANTLWTYSGYIWNRTATNENWTFASCIIARGKVLLDGNTVVYNEGPAATTAAGGVKQGSAVVTPGAHKLEIRLHTTTVSTSTASGGGAYNHASLANAHGTEAGYTWAAYKGIMLDRLGRQSHDYADYATIVDAGDGELLTTNNAPDIVTRTPNFDVSTVVSTNGTALLDLAGCSYELENIVGTPQFVNATTVTVLQAWTLTALSVVPLTCDGTLSFGADSVLTLDGFTSPKRMGVTDGTTEFTVATAGSIDGMPTLTGAKPQWALVKEGNVLKLKYTTPGLVLLFR